MTDDDSSKALIEAGKLLAREHLRADRAEAELARLRESVRDHAHGTCPICRATSEPNQTVRIWEPAVPAPAIRSRPPGPPPPSVRPMVTLVARSPPALPAPPRGPVPVPAVGGSA